MEWKCKIYSAQVIAVYMASIITGLHILISKDDIKTKILK